MVGLGMMTTEVESEVEVVVGYPNDAVTNFGRHTFPSKIGGRPVFLLGTPFCTPQCKECGGVMRFVLQIYAPVEASHGEAFHRTLYVYVCGKVGCLRTAGDRAMCVIRAQLPRRNGLYAYDAGGKQPTPPEPSWNLCVACGGKANVRCGACSEVWYCGRQCQKADWKMGHKRVCGGCDADAARALELARRYAQFREVYLSTEAAEDDSGTDTESEEDETASVGELQGTMQDASAEELPEDIFKSRQAEDEVYERFKQVTRNPPDQVVRYARGGSCLWMHSKGQAGKETARRQCVECQGPLQFEFQVLPQFLFYAQGGKEGLGKASDAGTRLRNEIEWGILGVWTCTASCRVGERYVREAGWVQPSA